MKKKIPEKLHQNVVALPKRSRGTSIGEEGRALAIAKAAEVLALGASQRAACRAAGVSDSMLSQWVDRAEAGDPMFASIASAIASAEVDLLRTVRGAADAGEWKAAAWLLERVHPERYSRVEIKREQYKKEDVESVISTMSKTKLRQLAAG